MIRHKKENLLARTVLSYNGGSVGIIIVILLFIIVILLILNNMRGCLGSNGKTGKKEPEKTIETPSNRQKPIQPFNEIVFKDKRIFLVGKEISREGIEEWLNQKGAQRKGIQITSYDSAKYADIKWFKNFVKRNKIKIVGNFEKP